MQQANVKISVEYRIMGVPSRAANTRFLQEQLEIPASKVFVDFEMRRNPMWTWKQTVSPNPETLTTHLCVVQDDAILCGRFKEFVGRVVRRHPDDIIFLFNRCAMGNKVPMYSLVNTGCCTGGLVSVVPAGCVRDIIREQEERYPDYVHDDNWLTFWAYNHGRKVIAPYPSVVKSMDGSEMWHDMSDAPTFCDDPMSRHWVDATASRWSTRQKFDEPVM